MHVVGCGSARQGACMSVVATVHGGVHACCNSARQNACMHVGCSSAWPRLLFAGEAGVQLGSSGWLENVAWHAYYQGLPCV
jgi:hypothetical protein